MKGNFLATKKRTLVDQDTGEVFETEEVLTPRAGYVPYLNLTKRKLAEWLICGGGPQDRVKSYIVSNIKDGNILTKTVDEIAEEAKVNRNTVSKTLSNLGEANLIKHISHGKWMINPAYYCSLKTSEQKRLQNQYDSIQRKQAGRKKGVIESEKQ